MNKMDENRVEDPARKRKRSVSSDYSDETPPPPTYLPDTHLRACGWNSPIPHNSPASPHWSLEGGRSSESLVSDPTNSSRSPETPNSSPWGPPMAAQGESTLVQHHGKDVELTKEIDILATIENRDDVLTTTTIEHRDETNAKGFETDARDLSPFLHETAKNPLRYEAMARAIERDDQKKYDEKCEFFDTIVGLLDHIPDLRCLFREAVYPRYVKVEALKAPEEQNILIALAVMKEWLVCTDKVLREAEKFAEFLDSVQGFVGETTVGPIVRDIKKPLDLGYKLREMLDARLLEVSRENATSMRASGEIAPIDASRNVLQQ